MTWDMPPPNPVDMLKRRKQRDILDSMKRKKLDDYIQKTKAIRSLSTRLRRPRNYSSVVDNAFDFRDVVLQTQDIQNIVKKQLMRRHNKSLILPKKSSLSKVKKNFNSEISRYSESLDYLKKKVQEQKQSEQERKKLTTQIQTERELKIKGETNKHKRRMQTIDQERKEDQVKRYRDLVKRINKTYNTLDINYLLQNKDENWRSFV
jgi:murein L,D-transpeptidase YafK